MNASGYSGTPLSKKLGLRPSLRAMVVSAPDHYRQLLTDLPSDFQFHKRMVGRFDWLHFFCRTQRQLQDAFRRGKDKLDADGSLWISWPKKSSSLAGELNDQLVRDSGLAAGLVDVKVCAIDADWSGLKFMYRKADRPSVRAEQARH